MKLPKDFVGSGSNMRAEYQRVSVSIRDAYAYHMQMMLYLTFTNWSFCSPAYICTATFRAIFDQNDFYRDLDITLLDPHPLLTTEFWTMMLIVDIFEYRMFTRVVTLLGFIEALPGAKNDYVSCIFRLMHPDGVVRRQGFELFKKIVSIRGGLWCLKKWRQALCTQIHKIHDIRWDHNSVVNRFCLKHLTMGGASRSEGTCYECLADYELKCYSHHLEFLTSIYGELD